MTYSKLGSVDPNFISRYFFRFFDLPIYEISDSKLKKESTIKKKPLALHFIKKFVVNSFTLNSILPSFSFKVL